MKRVIVIGCARAGKSSFARRLRDKTGLPLYYLDMIWHRPNGTELSREAFDEKIRELMELEEWIIDGNYSRTLELRLERCDTVFFLDYPVEVCLEGAASRIGTKREDFPYIEKEFDEDFRQWIINFPQTNLPRLYSLTEAYRDIRDFHLFSSRAEADEYLNSI